ncbi:unnamed protein product [Paramecium sonneborni]|uniref:Aurora kinase n=1 Tax=Paramecium sonneborni TaxID=65129 RepID=A0A8S1N4W1_9CILI|nr:unnamed protein product [Paramecium sonneborni]
MSNGLVINQVKERILFFSPTVQGRMEREACTQDFEVIQGLGQGAFGKVFKVRHKKTKMIFALKQIAKKQIKQQKMTQQIINEVKIMYGLEHPNIVKLYNHYEEEDYIYLILECATGGQLWQKLNRVGRFDEKTVKQFMQEAMSAIEYLHTRNPPIIHRDIKPENILLDANGHIKIADFGWSNINNHQRTTYCGTLDYLAPEMILECGHDEKIDNWSLGVLIYELLTGKAPFAPSSQIKDQKESQKILEDNILKVKINFPNDFPSLAKSLVQGLLQKDPQKRFNIQKMREHPWFGNCQIQQETQSEQKVKAENIKDIIKDDKAQFSKEEIAKVVNRQLNQQKEEDDVIIVVEDQKEKEKESTHDFQKNTVQLLNNKITDLQKQLNESKILLQVKIDEIKQLQSQQEQPNLQMNVDTRKIKLLEEEKIKWKQAYEQIRDELHEKQAENLKLNAENEKIQQLTKSLEKQKADKQLLQEKIKKLQEEIEQKDQQILELRTEQDCKLQSSFHGSFLNQSTIEDGKSVADLNSTFLEMKNSFQIAREQIEEFDKAQRRIIQQEAEIIALKSQLNEYKESIRITIQEQYEDQIEELEKKQREQIRELEAKHFNEINKYENDKMSLRDQFNELENLKSDIGLSKKDLEQANMIIMDLKKQQEIDKRLRYQMDQKIKEQDILILDLKEKERVYRKK